MEHQYFRPPIRRLKKVGAIEFSTGCGGLSLGAGFFPFPQRSVSSFGGWNSNFSLGEGAVADRQSLFLSGWVCLKIGKTPKSNG